MAFEADLRPWSASRKAVADPHRSFSAAVSLAAHAAALVWLLHAAAPAPAEPAGLIAVEIVAAAIPEAEAQPEPAPPIPAKAEPPKPVEPPPLPKPIPPPKPVAKTPQTPKPVAPVAPPSAVITASEEPATTAPAVSTQTAPVAPAAATEDDLRLYGQTLWTRIIDHKPSHVRRQGRVHLSFTLARDGQLVASAVAASSGSDLLDQAALAALREAAPFPPPPEAVADRQLTFSIPFEFR
ncbi:MAG TPA: TonB family protein [Patescibacteria group bacterium]|nr:TonB family protein [Patescibacteria group bacterium]